MKPVRSALWGALFLLAGCASFSGSGLVPGQSTAKDVQALMGDPAETLKIADGGAIWYYPRGPVGLQTYAVHMSAGGVMQSIEQLLTEENMRKLVPGTTTTAQVREQFGPPGHVTRFDRQQRDVWEYRMWNSSREVYFLYVQFSYDGIVREALFLQDHYYDLGGPAKN